MQSRRIQLVDIRNHQPLDPHWSPTVDPEEIEPANFLLAERQLTLTALAEMVGITIVNLSVLKNNRAKAIKFSTLTAICDALECSVGDLLVVRPTDHRG